MKTVLNFFESSICIDTDLLVRWNWTHEQVDENTVRFKRTVVDKTFHADVYCHVALSINDIKDDAPYLIVSSIGGYDVLPRSSIFDRRRDEASVTLSLLDILNRHFCEMAILELRLEQMKACKAEQKSRLWKAEYERLKENGIGRVELYMPPGTDR